MNKEDIIRLPKIKSRLFDLKDKAILPNKSGVYAFYSEEGYLIYIGKTTSFKTRMYYHQSESYKKFIDRIEVFEIDNVVNMDLYETYLINKWKPLLNIRKTITYIPLTRNHNDYSRFESVDDIIKTYNPEFNPKKIKRSSSRLKIDEICESINLIMKNHEKMEISTVREKLDSIGYNVNLIITKEDFKELLKLNGYEVSDRYVRRGLVENK